MLLSKPFCLNPKNRTSFDLPRSEFVGRRHDKLATHWKVNATAIWVFPLYFRWDLASRRHFLCARAQSEQCSYLERFKIGQNAPRRRNFAELTRFNMHRKRLVYPTYTAALPGTPFQAQADGSSRQSFWMKRGRTFNLLAG